jgi:hypothetical protein
MGETADALVPLAKEFVPGNLAPHWELHWKAFGYSNELDFKSIMMHSSNAFSVDKTTGKCWTLYRREHHVNEDGKRDRGVWMGGAEYAEDAKISEGE